MLGADRLGHWASEYGFGQPSGIDLPGEVAGIVPTNQWKQDTLGAPMFAGETYQAGIGQGYDAVTPIQLINAFAALANGGTLYQPQIVRDVVGPDGTVIRPFEPKVLHEMDVKPSVLKDATRPAPKSSRCAYNLVDMPVRSPASPARRVRRPGPPGRLPFPLVVGFRPATRGQVPS
jgi:penicillin-binding protein 2